MAHIFVKNSLNTTKAAKIDINFPIFVTTDSDGDPIWVLETASTYLSDSGKEIVPTYINKTTEFNNLDDVVAETVSEIARQIDWLPLVEDTDPPYVTDFKPVGGNVSIASNIYMNIREDAPSAGIDLSDVEIILNNGNTDFNITNDCVIKGTPFNYNINWETPWRFTRHYREE